MGASTRDIFGEAGGAQPAHPGTYGEAPAGFRLPDAAHPGLVRLQVSHLAESLAFYTGTLGLRVLDAEGPGAVLGPLGEDRPLVELHERRGATTAPRRGRIGLYHFAILLPDRPALGRFLTHLGNVNARAGSADHLVSEALYLQDPDNLGIEVYADRPRAAWRRIGRQLMMATDPLDVPGLVGAAAGEPWTGMPAGTTMGHLHLHVGDIPTASAFYSASLGFDRTVWEYPGALFLGAGGYHHHLGTNTWAGAGARPPSVDEAQLLEWSIGLPARTDVDAAGESLARGGFPAERDDVAGALITRDPWGTRVRLHT